MAALKKPEHNPEQVQAFLAKLEHPFKAEVLALRKIILAVNPAITEQIKWNAPSFSYVDYLATFNLHARQHVHLVFHNGAILNDKSGLLQGDYPDRRMAYFSGMPDVKAGQAALEKVVRDWIRLMDRQTLAKEAT